MKKLYIVLSLIIFLNNVKITYASDFINGETLFYMGENGIAVEGEKLSYNSDWVSFKDAKASQGTALKSVTDNKGINYDEYSIKEGSLKIKIHSDYEKNYSFYIRVLNQQRLTMFCRINDDKKFNFTYVETDDSDEKYSWYKLFGYRFKKGENLIEIVPRHDFILDKILITDNAVDKPQGFGEEILPFSFKTLRNEKYYYEIPDKIPLGSHPKLLLNSENKEKVKANLTHKRNIDVYNKLLKDSKRECDGILKNNGTRCNAKRSYLDTIEANAFLYALDKDCIKGRKAVTAILNYVSTFNALPLSPEASREGMEMIFTVALVYDWCYDIITLKEKENLVNQSIHNISKSDIGWPPLKLSASLGHGEEIAVPCILSLGIAVYDEYPYLYETICGKVLTESIWSRNKRYEENAFNNQGDYYSMIRTGSDLFLRLLLSQVGLDNLIDENQRYSPYQFIYRTTPVGSGLKDGDSPSYTSLKANNGGISTFLGGTMFKDPYLMSEFYNFYNKGYFFKDKPYLSDSLFLILNDVNSELKEVDELPLSCFFGKSSGILTARTKWDKGRNSDALIVSMKTPERNFGGHQHMDAGHFYIYYKGALALDSGVYSGKPFIKEDGTVENNVGFSSDHNKNYAKQTIAHNAMLIYDPLEDTKGVANNGGQYPDTVIYDSKEEFEKTSKLGTVLGVDWGENLNEPSYTYLKGDITNWYRDKLFYYTRSFMFLNFFDDEVPGALIVFDNVLSKNPDFKKYWLLHSEEEPVINNNVTTVKKTDSYSCGKLINETLLPKKDNLKITKVGGENLEYPDINHKNEVAYPKHEENDESGKWRIEVTPKNPSQSDYFLNVLQVSDGKKNIAPLETTYLEQGKFVGVMIKNNIVLFGKERAREKEKLSLEIPENPQEVQCIITDLESGKWDIYKDDLFIKSIRTSNESGVAVTLLPPGKYEIRKDFNDNKSNFKDLGIGKNTVSKEIKDKVWINDIREDNIDIIKKENTFYIPLKEFLRCIDNKSSLKTYEDKVNLNIFKNTIKEKELTFKLNSREIEILEKGIGKYVPKKQNINYPLISEKGKIYIPIEDNFLNLFESSFIYEDIAKIIKITCNFSYNNYTKKVYINKIGKGDVYPSLSEIYLREKDSIYINAVPCNNIGEYIKHNEKIVKSDFNKVESYVVKPKNNDVITVKFIDLSDTPCIINSHKVFKGVNLFKDNNNFIVFATIKGDLQSIEEAGFIIGDKKYKAEKITDFFGINFMIKNNLIKDFIVTPYIISEGKKTEGEPSLISMQEEKM